MLVDANLLLYARDADSAFHDAAAAWLTEQLNGTTRVGIPWPSLVAFVRIATHSRAYERPLTPSQGWDQVADWLGAAPTWVPLPGPRHAEILGGLVRRYDLRGNVVSDAHLAALAIEHGLEVFSSDTDFARFDEVRWTNPVAP